MSSTLIIVESMGDLNYLKKLTKENYKDHIFLTTDTAVQVKLKNLHLTYKNTLPYFGPDGHKFVSEATSSAVSLLRPNLGILSHRDVVHAFERTTFFYLRFFLNYIFSSLWIINNALNDIKPDRVIISSLLNIKKIDFDISNGVPLLGNILKLFAKNNNFEIVCISKSKSTSHFGIKTIIEKKIKEIYFSSMLLLYRSKIKKKKLVFIPSDAYGMSSVIEDLMGANDNILPVYLYPQKKTLFKRLKEMYLDLSFSFFLLSEDVSINEKIRFKYLLGKCLKKIQVNISLHESKFKYFDVDVSSLVFDFIDNVLAKKMITLHGNIEALYRIFKISAPNVALSQHALGVSYALGEICRAKRISALLISHGSHVPHTQCVAREEWREHARNIFVTHYQYVAIQTAWAERFLNNEPQLHSKFLRTGPLIFGKKSNRYENRDELRSKLFGKNMDNTVLLHAGTPKQWHNLRPWIYETPDEYIRNINHLITAVKEVHGIHLAIRYRPWRGLPTDLFRDLLIENDCYEIYDDGNFNDFLSASDMLVSYSSTTIEEALQNKIPVLQFDPDDKYWHIPPEFLVNQSCSSLGTLNCASTNHDLIKIFQHLKSKHFDMNESDWNQHIITERDAWIEKIL